MVWGLDPQPACKSFALPTELTGQTVLGSVSEIMFRRSFFVQNMGAGEGVIHSRYWTYSLNFFATIHHTSLTWMDINFLMEDRLWFWPRFNISQFLDIFSWSQTFFYAYQAVIHFKIRLYESLGLIYFQTMRPISNQRVPISFYQIFKQNGIEQELDRLFYFYTLKTCSWLVFSIVQRVEPLLSLIL